MEGSRTLCLRSRVPVEVVGILFFDLVEIVGEIMEVSHDLILCSNRACTFVDGSPKILLLMDGRRWWVEGVVSGEVLSLRDRVREGWQGTTTQHFFSTSSRNTLCRGIHRHQGYDFVAR